MGWFSDDKPASSEAAGTGLVARAEAFQRSVDTMLSGVTRMSLPLQKGAFECCVRCFDSGNENLDQIGDCVKQCQTKPEKFGQAVQTELNQLQDVLQSCQQKCFNQYSTAQGMMNQATTADIERCAVKCYDNNEGMLKDISDRLNRIYRNF